MAPDPVTASPAPPILRVEYARHFKLRFATSLKSPTIPFATESNTAAFVSITEGFGWLSDRIGKIERGGDEFFPTRVGLLGLAGVVHGNALCWSHELNHPQNSLYNGRYAPYSLGLNFGNCPGPYPAPPDADHPFYEDHAGEFFFGSPRGYQVHNYNGMALSRLSTEEGSTPFDRSLGKLWIRAFGGFYYRYTSKKKDPLNISLLQEVVRDVHVDKETARKYAMLATFLSFRTWEDAHAVANYLFAGERRTDLVSYKDVIYPPEFVLHPYADGFYFVGELPIKPPVDGGAMLYLNTGYGVLGDPNTHFGFEFEGARPFGQKWYQPEVGGKLTLSHSPVRRVKRHTISLRDTGEFTTWVVKGEKLDARGVEAGATVLFGNGLVQYGVGLSYLHNDVLENIIDQKPNGWWGSFEFSYLYY